MKNKLIVLAVILVLIVIAAAGSLPAADVDFALIDNMDGTGTLQYTVNTGDPPVAMGLEIDVTTPVVGVTMIDSFFDVFMDSAYTQELGTGYVYQTGTPVCDCAGGGEVALPRSNFCLSMGIARNGRTKV